MWILNSNVKKLSVEGKSSRWIYLSGEEERKNNMQEKIAAPAGTLSKRSKIENWKMRLREFCEGYDIYLSARQTILIKYYGWSKKNEKTYHTSCLIYLTWSKGNILLCQVHIIIMRRTAARNIVSLWTKNRTAAITITINNNNNIMTTIIYLHQQKSTHSHYTIKKKCYHGSMARSKQFWVADKAKCVITTVSFSYFDMEATMG